jgi:hypothetical protein
MGLPVSAFALVVVLLIVVISVVAVARVAPRQRPIRSLRRAAVRLADALRGAVGSGWGFLFVMLAGTAATVAILWPLGAIAGRIHPFFDLHAYQWLVEEFEAGTMWSDASTIFTQIGDPIQSLATVIILSVIMASAWPGRRWVALVVLGSALASEWFSQRVIGAVVTRGYPPFGNGTFPSGGTARVIVIYGALVLLATVRWPTLSRRWRTAAWAGVAVLAVLEAYSRLYLLKHWPLDVPAGALFGGLLLLTTAVGTIVLVPVSPEPE